MGSYSPPPVSLEVEKSSWQEIGRVNMPNDTISLHGYSEILIDENSRRLIYFTQNKLLIVNFTTSQYTVSDIEELDSAYMGSRDPESIRRRYIMRMNQPEDRLCIMKNGVQILLPLHNIRFRAWGYWTVVLSPSGRHAAILAAAEEDVPPFTPYIAAVLYG